MFDGDQLKALHLNYSDINGGAARAAYRIHHALRESGMDSRMLVNVCSSDDWTVRGPMSKWSKAYTRIRPYLAAPLRKLLLTGNPIIHSPSIIPSRYPQQINASDSDVVHLHWVQGEMLSISDIPHIRKPIVWTLHDMWAFCGAEHYTTDYRWRDGYSSANRPDDERGFDLNRNTWLRKQKHWKRPLHIVCPSQWLADCVRTSSLLRGWPVSVIPNPIDTTRWSPIDKDLARQLLCLPQDCTMLLFGAIGGGNDPRKGIDLLLSALTQLRDDDNQKNLQLVIFGQLAPQTPLKLGFPVHYIGHLYDDLSLRVLYSSADAFVIPSRQEAFGQTASESHACGTPVVAFNSGGLTDIVVDRVTGSLAEPYEPASLASSLRWVLEDPIRRRAMGVAARERAERLWASARVAKMYKNVYQSAINST